MRKKSAWNVKFVGMATAVIAVCCLAWMIFFADGTLAHDATALAVEFVCWVILVFLFFRQSDRRRAVSRCELCNRKMGAQTDHMIWAHRYGLEACHDCSFKLQFAFDTVEPREAGRTLH